MDKENPKDIVGATKPNLFLIPPIPQISEAVVFQLGAEKYGAYNWRDNKVKASVYIAAIQRHLLQYMDGADQDEESNESHLAHIRACCAILMDAEANDCLVDDRSKKNSVTQYIRDRTKHTPSIGYLPNSNS